MIWIATSVSLLLSICAEVGYLFWHICNTFSLEYCLHKSKGACRIYCFKNKSFYEFYFWHANFTTIQQVLLKGQTFQFARFIFITAQGDLSFITNICCYIAHVVFCQIFTTPKMPGVLVWYNRSVFHLKNFVYNKRIQSPPEVRCS